MNQHLNAHCHIYMQVHTCIYPVDMHVYVYVSPIYVDFDPLHLLQPSGSILLFISIANSNKDLIFSLLIWIFILLSSASVSAFQKETKARCPDDLLE